MRPLKYKPEQYKKAGALMERWNKTPEKERELSLSAISRVTGLPVICLRYHFIPNQREALLKQTASWRRKNRAKNLKKMRDYYYSQAGDN